MRRKQEDNVVSKCNIPVKQKRRLRPIYAVLAGVFRRDLVLLVPPTPAQSPGEGLKYTSNGDGTCYVSGIGTCADSDIVIPWQAPNGDRVTEIRLFAFSNCTSLTSVTIPDSVTSIGDFAFYRCSSLLSIVIPDSVTTIGEDAFYRCSSLASIVVDGANPSYQSIDGNLYTKNGDMLIQYAIGKTDTHFEIPDSVTTIDGYAFTGCTSLTSVTIPDSVTIIGERAFFECTSLTSIVIPNSVTTIGWQAFYECTSLTSIIIPDSVTSIDWRAFYNCTSLTDVYYTGSEADWQSISVGSDNEYLTSATIHYNYSIEE